MQPPHQRGDENGLIWHARSDVVGIAQRDADDCYRTSAQMLANALPGPQRPNFDAPMFHHAGMQGNTVAKQTIDRMLSLDFVDDVDEDVSRMESDKLFKAVVTALQNHGPLLATYTPDPVHPTAQHVVVVIGLATQVSTDHCLFMLRDPDPLKYHHIVAFQFEGFQAKLLSLRYSRKF